MPKNQSEAPIPTTVLPISEDENLSLKRTLSGWWMKSIYAVTAVMALYHIYILAFAPIDPWMFSITHLQFVMVLGFLFYAGRSKNRDKVGFIDIFLILASLSSFVYMMWEFDELVHRAGVLPEGYDTFFGLLAVITVIELTRRTAGWALTSLLLIFIAYCFAGPYLPGILWHKGYSFERLVSFLFSPNGIYNVPLGVTARFVYIFVLFGAFLELSGAAPFFMDFSYALAGRSRGGPAKVAIISSGLLGMVNGTSTGNVVTTGSLTIPLMKRTGYDPYFAGAVEAVASTGGQIMPPVMGAAVFLMAQMINKPYTDIMIAAIIPALLYYVALYLSVDLEAGRLKLLGVEKEMLPPWSQIRAQAHMALPILVLLYYLLFLSSSVVLAGLMGLASAIFIGVVDRAVKRKKMYTPTEVFDTIKSGGTNVIQITATCAAAGIIMGTLTLTGLGLKVATIVVDISGGSLLLTLFLTMGVTIILGMGLPTIAAYAIPASVVAPALLEMGVNEMAAHLFILYYASLSAITPPVALASYAAAAIAGVSPIKLAVIGLRLGMAGFIIPFMFVYGPQLLLMGNVSSIVLACVTALIGVYALSIAIVGYFKEPVSKPCRVLFTLAAVVLIKPGLYTDILGLAVFIALLLWQMRHGLFQPKNKPTQDTSAGD